MRFLGREAMSRYPVNVRTRKPVVIDAYPVREDTRGPFTSFRYSYTEISVSGGTTTVRSRTTKLQDGKLTSETFEGEADRSAYDRIVRSAQRQFIAQTALMFESLAAFLPVRKRSSGRD
jgi:hypothetical protein